MYFTKEQINTNINSQYGINNHVQESLTNGNTQFIIQLSKEMNISYTIPSLALHISQIFFQKKCYLFYDRFLILTASFALASKLKDMDCRLKSLCHSYYNIISRITMNFQPYNQQKMKKIKDEICIAETQILRTLQYKIDFDTPHDYLKKYVQTLSQPREIIKKVYNSSRIIILDSYRSKCCLLFNPLTISIAALLIACRYEGFRPYASEQLKEYVKSQEAKDKDKDKDKDKARQQKEQSREQGELPRDESQGVKNERSSQMNHEVLYSNWLKIIKQKEQEKLQQSDILQCIRMMNSIILDTCNSFKHWR